MEAKKCYHCGLVVSDWKTHDCWTTTEEKLTEELPEDLLDAWLRLRETAVAFGEQRIYASHNSIMFSRTNCYFFVRPKSRYLEIVFFLGRPLKDTRIKKSQATSRVKIGHITRVTHRDEVEPPLTDWLKEAYDVSETLRSAPKARVKKKTAARKTRKPTKRAKRR